MAENETRGLATLLMSIFFYLLVSFRKKEKALVVKVSSGDKECYPGRSLAKIRKYP
jgi:hypothetical protein